MRGLNVYASPAVTELIESKSAVTEAQGLGIIGAGFGVVANIANFVFNLITFNYGFWNVHIVAEAVRWGLTGYYLVLIAWAFGTIMSNVRTRL